MRSFSAFLLTATTLALVHPALAQSAPTVTDKAFSVTVTDADGNSQSNFTDVVPLVEGACFQWQLQLGKAKLPVDVTETFTLPSAPATWGTSRDDITISADRKTATSPLTITPVDGWIWHGWCIAEGDPAGAHRFEITANGTQIGVFDFTVEPPRRTKQK